MEFTKAQVEENSVDVLLKLMNLRINNGNGVKNRWSNITILRWRWSASRLALSKEASSVGPSQYLVPMIKDRTRNWLCRPATVFRMVKLRERGMHAIIKLMEWNKQKAIEVILADQRNRRHRAWRPTAFESVWRVHPWASWEIVKKRCLEGGKRRRTEHPPEHLRLLHPLPRAEFSHRWPKDMYVRKEGGGRSNASRHNGYRSVDNTRHSLHMPTCPS